MLKIYSPLNELNVVYMFLLVMLLAGCTIGQSQSNVILSPDSRIAVEITVDEHNHVFYSVRFNETTVLESSRLGIIRDDQNFANHLELISASEIIPVEDRYRMLHGKQKDITYSANRKILHFKNGAGHPMDVVFQLSNDGVAFRYVFPDTSDENRKILDEITGFSFPEKTRTWIQPMSGAKSGWSQVNPSYEEYYEQDIQLDSLQNNHPGWVFPALFRTGNHWILLSETAPDRNYSGTRLKHRAGSYEMEIGFPQKQEVIMGGPLNPRSTLPWYTPWRIITVGDHLETIVESTLGTDLATPSILDDTSFIQPGRASWSWALLKDGSVTYEMQKRFIDFAADMGWEFCLIDVNWDTMIGYEKMEELVKYADKKGVGIFLWYNSAGDWNTTPYHPKNELLTEESRHQVFSRLREMGVKGIKVDFFGGDGQSVMSYYQDIFEDAAEHRLLVNCHGSTLPRGWQRTYPNLLTMEAVKGFEFVTFEQVNADRQPTHAAMLPFARNIFDPMDYTPVVFSNIPGRVERVTTNGFELALVVLFHSGVQHYAVLPESMEKVPDYVKNLMKEIPIVWDETRFVGGFPGKWVALARRTGNTWYVAGINGTGEEMQVALKLPFIKTAGAVLVTDGEEERSFIRKEVTSESDGGIDVDVKRNGGFLLKIEG